MARRPKHIQQRDPVARRAEMRVLALWKTEIAVGISANSVLRAIWCQRVMPSMIAADKEDIANDTHILR